VLSMKREANCQNIAMVLKSSSSLQSGFLSNWSIGALPALMSSHTGKDVRLLQFREEFPGGFRVAHFETASLVVERAGWGNYSPCAGVNWKEAWCTG
jgi:hypothetical protein